MTQSALARAFTYYAAEACAWCEATGAVFDVACPVCGGKGNVLTVQPGVKCTRCKGTGRRVSPAATDSRCAVCHGSGWLTRS